MNLEEGKAGYLEEFEEMKGKWSDVIIPSSQKLKEIIFKKEKHFYRKDSLVLWPPLYSGTQ